MWNADQLHVGKHHAGTLVTVIEQHIDPGSQKLIMKLVSHQPDHFALGITHRHDAHLKGRNGGRKHDAALVVILLDGRPDDARNADTIAAHFHYLALAVFIEEAALERLGILLAQLKDMTDLDSATDFQRSLAVRRRIANEYIAQISHLLRFGQITTEIDVFQVIAGIVGTANEVAHHGHTAIGIDRNRADADRAKVTRLTAQRSDNFLVSRETEFTNDFLCLDLVQNMVTAQQQHDQLAVLAILDATHHGNDLDSLCQWQAEQRGNILTTLLVRRSHLFHRSARRPTRCGGSNGFGKFDVGGKVRRRTVSNGVLARIGQHVELM